MRRPMVVRRVTKSYTSISTNITIRTLGNPLYEASIQQNQMITAANAMFLARKNAPGSSSILWRTCPARSRSFIANRAMATTAPMASELMRSVWPLKKSGMKPELSSWKSSGNGPTDCPCSSASARPLKTSMPASVTMNDGIFR